MENSKNYNGDLILVRGLPGSGKTTLSKIILQNPAGLDPEVLSADDFFTNDDDEYKFDLLKLKEAHNYCEFRCSERMRQGISRIVVANTFSEESDMDVYFNMADRYRYRVHTIIVENRHGNKNIHDVPQDKVEIMRDKFSVKLL